MKNNDGRAISVLKSWKEMNRFTLLNFKIFWGGAMPPDPTPSALRASLGLRPFHCPSLCVIDILRYFSGPGVSGNRNLPVTSPILDH